MTFRRRRRVNWVTVIGLIIGIIGLSSLLYQHYGLPKGLTKGLNQLPMFPKPTATATPRVDDGAAVFTDAEKLFNEGKLDQAVEQYDLAATAAERAQGDLQYIADKLDGAGNKTDAATRRTEAQNALQRAAKGYVGSCKILALRQKTDDALARCNRAIELDPRSAEAYAFLALAYDRKNEYDKAIAAAQRAVDLDPTLAEGYGFLAEAYADKSAFEKRIWRQRRRAWPLTTRAPLPIATWAGSTKRRATTSRRRSPTRKPPSSCPTSATSTLICAGAKDTWLDDRGHGSLPEGDGARSQQRRTIRPAGPALL